MTYKELVAEGEKKQIHKRFEWDESQCPDTKALQAYYDEQVEHEDETKQERVDRIITEYVAKRKKETQ